MDKAIEENYTVSAVKHEHGLMKFSRDVSYKGTGALIWLMTNSANYQKVDVSETYWSVKDNNSQIQKCL